MNGNQENNDKKHELNCIWSTKHLNVVAVAQSDFPISMS
jgi:hypothetical protein